MANTATLSKEERKKVKREMRKKREAANPRKKRTYARGSKKRKVKKMVKGQRKLSARKFYPGYILVHMELTDDTWHLVKDTPKVTGFIGSKDEPVAIPEEDAAKIIAQMQEGVLRPKPKIKFEQGDKVQVTDGPFANFAGVVDEVRPDRGRVRVMISVFGRATPVELEFTQLEKI